MLRKHLTSTMTADVAHCSCSHFEIQCCLMFTHIGLVL